MVGKIKIKTVAASFELFNDIWPQLHPKYLCLSIAKEWPIWFRLTPLSVRRLGRKECTGRTGQAVPTGSTTYHQPSEIPPRFTPLWIISPTGTIEHWKGEKSDRLFRKTQGALGIVSGGMRKKKERGKSGDKGEREMQDGENKGRGMEEGGRGRRVERKWGREEVFWCVSLCRGGIRADGGSVAGPAAWRDWLVY